MKGLVPGHTKTYAETFYDIGTRLKVSPLHLACRVYQEQGTGESPLISGTYAPYEGYYNYFNIGASGSTNEAIYNSGLKKAQQYGWSTHLRSLEGGAEVLSSNYILRGQDTLYLQKFDVDDKYDGLYWHQYMQNISAPSNEGKNIKNIYEQAGLLDINRIFIIPVFQEMPQVASPYPSISYHISFEVDESYTGNIIYLDGVKKEVTREGNRISFTADNDKATTVTMYRYNENNVPIGMRVWSLEFGKTKYEITLLPQFEDLLSYHGFSIRITGNPGMRFKAGISEKIKKDLVQSNINGFTLKEYGGILMKESRASAYPLIYDGQYTLKGVAYGTVNGSFTDKVYETIAGRNRFTTVLVGMAPNAYKENLIFRG